MGENITFVVGFQRGIKSKFKALKVFVFVCVFFKFSLFQVKSVVVGIAQSTETETTKQSDFPKNLQLSATLVSSWACNSISHFWCKEIQISSAKEIQISSAKESVAGSSLEQLQHSLLPSYSKYRGKKYSRGW